MEKIRAETLQRLMQLSERERQIVAMILAGLATKQIAARLHLSYKTVENRRSLIYRKMQVDGVADLVAIVVPLLGRGSSPNPKATATCCGLRTSDRRPCQFNPKISDTNHACPLFLNRSALTNIFALVQ